LYSGEKRRFLIGCEKGGEEKRKEMKREGRGEKEERKRDIDRSSKVLCEVLFGWVLSSPCKRRKVKKEKR
jgi:hypothetical protein